MIGKTTVDNRSVTVSRGSQGSYSMAEQIVARDLIDAAEIGKMGKMECLVLITGCDPFKSRKYATKGHKRYAWVDPHPEKHPDG
ncbi:MAG: type IV secretory system conjugative DNA transfer family protein, partial [Erysipelotrichaceae bacterium]|nr:type IV secretory system conjugative DNA transfer family protein [Erysipelotrichaceae bacterium]